MSSFEISIECAFNGQPAGNGYCTTTCPNVGMSMVEAKCITCDANCKTCTGTAPTDCSSCYSGSYLVVDNNTCSSCNSESYYIDNSLCKRCDSNCRTCTGPSATDCLSCRPGLTLRASSCWQDYTSDADYTPSAAMEAATTASSIALNVQTATTSILPTLGTTTALILIDFISDVLVYRFINVPFPSNFIEFIAMLQTNFLPNPYTTLSEELNVTMSQIGQFQNYQVAVPMFTNCGDNLDREIIAIVLILLSIIFTAITGKYALTRAHRFFKGIRDNIMWNLLLTFYIADFPEIFLFSLIQFREWDNDESWYARYSFAFSILFVSSYVLLFGFIFYLINRKAPEDAEGPRIPFWISMISDGLKQKSRFTRNFILIIVLQNCLEVLLILLFQDYGLFQAAVYTGIELTGLILAGIVSRPFISRLQNFIFITNSSYKIVFGSIAVLFGLNQQKIFLTDAAVNTLGTLLVATVISAIATNAGVGIIATLRPLFQLCKSKKKKNTVHPELPSPIPLGEGHSAISSASPSNCQSMIITSRLKLQATMTTLSQKAPTAEGTPRGADDFELYSLNSQRNSQRKLITSEELLAKVKQRLKSSWRKESEVGSIAELMDIQVLDQRPVEEPPSSQRNLDSVHRIRVAPRSEINLEPPSKLDE